MLTADHFLNEVYGRVDCSEVWLRPCLTEGGA